MGDTKHSPGPWKACGADRGGCQCGLIWSIAADRAVAEVLAKDEEGDIDPGTRAANVALIARAPEMADDIDQLRRDLATRDRELADARDRLDENRQLVKDATDTIARRNADHDELAAKLADVTFSAQQNWKLYDQARRELAEAKQDRDTREAEAALYFAERDQARAALAGKEHQLSEARTFHTDEYHNRVSLTEQLAAAQEEAKRLWTHFESCEMCSICLAESNPALAARQQQTDGKPETLRDHVARHKEGDEGP